mmetsp:Transcript_26103/g.64827  ORF Transcript_26103/g.64827 Transcript_26103/m.64827 type:complete len:250 (+) Transcript_26103:3836-4585(+)
MTCLGGSGAVTVTGAWMPPTELRMMAMMMFLSFSTSSCTRLSDQKPGESSLGGGRSRLPLDALDSFSHVAISVSRALPHRRSRSSAILRRVSASLACSSLVHSWSSCWALRRFWAMRARVLAHCWAACKAWWARRGSTPRPCIWPYCTSTVWVQTFIWCVCCMNVAMSRSRMSSIEATRSGSGPSRTGAGAGTVAGSGMVLTGGWCTTTGGGEGAGAPTAICICGGGALTLGTIKSDGGGERGCGEASR